MSLLQALLKSASARLPSRKKVSRKKRSASSSSGAPSILDTSVRRGAHGSTALPALPSLASSNAVRSDQTPHSCISQSTRNVSGVDSKRLVENWAYGSSKMSSKKLQLVPVSPAPMNITMLKQSKRRLWMVSNPLYVGYQDNEFGSEKMIKSCRPRFY